MRRPRRNEDPGAAGDKPVTFLSSMREAIAGGTVFGTSAAPPPGRAERLGLSPVAQGEFSADEQAGARGAAAGGWSSFRYHVVAAELGFLVPWLAIAVPSTPSPSQRLYPGRRGHDLATGSRKVDRSYRLYADDVTAARRVIEPAMSGWALAAVQARGMVTPDAVAIRLRQEHPHPGHAGPWPDALLAVLAAFRDLVPPACREPVR